MWVFFDMSFLKSVFSLLLSVFRIVFIILSHILDKIMVRNKTKKTMDDIAQHVIENSTEESLIELSECDNIYGSKARRKLKK